MGNKPDAAAKPDVKEKDDSEVPEKKRKDESSSSKKKAVEAFELPGIQTETPPKVRAKSRDAGTTGAVGASAAIPLCIYKFLGAVQMQVTGV